MLASAHPSQPSFDRSAIAAQLRTRWWKIIPIVCAIWAVFAVLAGVANFFDLRMLGMRASVKGQILLFLTLLSPKVLVSCVLALYFERDRDDALNARNLFRVFFYLMLFALPFDCLWEAFIVVSRRATSPFTWNALLDSTSPMSLWMNMVLINFAYSMQLAYSFWRKNQRRFAEAQAARQHYLQLRMQQLQGKLEPHFLLSSLEDITELVINAEPQLATKALARLSELLRHVLDSTEDEWRSVEDELQVLQDFIALQKLRFGEHLQITWHGREQQWHLISCPPMMFLPLLDLAVRALAIELSQGSKELALDCALENERFTFSISMLSSLSSFGQISSAMSEVNERARLAFGESAYCDENVRLDSSGRHLSLVLSFPARERTDD